MTEVTFKAPTNHRSSQSCGTCKNWSWGYEGEGNCLKFPSYVSVPGGGPKEIYQAENSTMLCDDWELTK